jgi:uncharacterized membrane protein
MSEETLLYVKAAHLLGFTLWIAGLATVYWLLRVHAAAPKDARDLLSGVERSLAMLMDLGATVAIASGLTMAFAAPASHWGGASTAFGSGGWIHVKLTLVVVGVLAVHGFNRAKVKRFRMGQVTEIPNWPWLLLLASTAGIIVIAAARLLRH